MIHGGMKALCDRLGAAAARTADILVMMEGTSLRVQGETGNHRIFALLSQVSYSPKFQDWTICEPSRSTDTTAEVLQLPLQLTLGMGRPPYAALGFGGECLRHEASSDLAARMSAIALHWRLRVCQYKLVSPMQMEMHGFEPSELLDIQCRDIGRARRLGGAAAVAADLAVIRELEHLGDPLSTRGTSRGTSGTTRPARSARRPGIGSGAGASLPDAGPPSAPDPDAEGIWGDDPTEVRVGDSHGDDFALAVLEQPPPVDEQLAILSHEFLIPAIDAADLEHADIAPEDEAQPPLDAVLADGGAGVGAFADAGRSPTSLGGGDEQLERATAAIVEVVELAATASGISEASPTTPAAAGASSSGAASISAAGPAPPPQPETAAPVTGASSGTQGAADDTVAIGNPILDGPIGWTMTAGGYIFCDQRRYRGRITAWATNVSIKCALHGCQKAKGRAKISDGRLVHWLAEGLAQCSPGEDAPPRDVLKKNHLRLFPM